MNLITDRIKESIEVKGKILADPLLLEKIEISAQTIISCFNNGHRLYFCGNGGSAADAQHLAAEFSGRYYFDRPPLPAEALHVNSSYITAVGNDYSYDLIYSRYIAGAGSRGDVLVGISTSGNSGNIIQAMIKAREIGMEIIAFTGSTGGKMKEHANILLNVPSTDTPRIQESHITIGHIICEIVESALFKK